MNKKVSILTLLLITSLFPISSHSEQNKVYTIGIVPQFEIRHVRKIWNPILNEIEKKNGL